MLKDTKSPAPSLQRRECRYMLSHCFSGAHSFTPVSSDSFFQLVFVEFISIILLSLLVQQRNGKKLSQSEVGNERERETTAKQWKRGTLKCIGALASSDKTHNTPASNSIKQPSFCAVCSRHGLSLQHPKALFMSGTKRVCFCACMCVCLGPTFLQATLCHCVQCGHLLTGTNGIKHCR